MSCSSCGQCTQEHRIADLALSCPADSRSWTPSLSPFKPEASAWKLQQPCQFVGSGFYSCYLPAEHCLRSLQVEGSSLLTEPKQPSLFGLLVSHHKSWPATTACSENMAAEEELELEERDIFDVGHKPASSLDTTKGTACCSGVARRCDFCTCHRRVAVKLHGWQGSSQLVCDSEESCSLNE